MGLPSCTQTDDMEIPTETKSEIRVNFTISFSEAASRALDESSKGALAGTAQENSINQYDFRMPVYYNDTEGTYFSEIIVQTIRGNENGTEYTVAGVLKTNDISQVATKGIRVAVLANCGIPFNATFEGTTLKGLPTTYAYNFDPSFTIGQDRIPMVGISDELTSLSETATNDLDQIDLLRAMAKVEVALDDKFTGYELTKVVLHNYNSKGYCSPISLADISNNNGENNNPADTWLGLGLNIPETPGLVKGNITKESSNYIFYVPEYNNVEAADDNKSYLTVTLKKTGNNATEDYNIYFSVYDNGEPTTEALDLKRNHYYQYNILGINNGLSANLEVTANEWNLQKVSVNYKAEAATDGTIKWDANVLQNGEVKLGGNTMSTGISFNLVGPTDGTWTATLIRTEGLSGAFSFDGNTVVEQVSGEVGKTAILTIHAMNETVTENCKAKLQIVVKTQDGTRTIDVTEMLNANHLIVQSK